MKKLLTAICLSFSILTAYAGDGWTLTDNDFSDKYHAVPIANGMLGMVPGKDPFQIRNVILSNLYDTRKDGDVSRLVYAVNPFVLQMSVDGETVTGEGVSGWSQTLDMKRAFLSCGFVYNDKARISYTLRALRNLPYCGLVSVHVEALKPVEIGISSEIKVPKDFIDARTREFVQDVNHVDFSLVNTSAVTANRGILVAASSCLFTGHGDCPAKITLAAGEGADFFLLGSVCSGQDFLDPRNEADREIIYALGEGVDRIVRRHESAWEDLWKGDVIIEGDDDAQLAVRSSLFNLYSSAREGCSASIPPFGFSCREYNGHIFWDSEIWMYPPMLFLNQGIATSMINYRTDRLDAARKKASAYGFRGAMFPWESDSAGEEACPTDAPTGAFEHHITADVAIGAWNYFRMTGDMDWLREKGYPLLKDVADFWVSRVEPSQGGYSIGNVVCADEFAEGVTDNAFTNGSAIVALRAAVSAAALCGKKADPKWSEVAEGIRIIHGRNGITMEYDGYDGAVIKQADVNLLSYPLQIITDAATVRKDLEYYEEKIHPQGPAMSFAILSLEWARLGNGKKAYKLFQKALEGHLHGPFLAFSETAGSGDTFFMTGCGGLLQAVINGFCGLELTDSGVVQVPAALPKHWRSVTVTGVGPERKTYTNSR